MPILHHRMSHHRLNPETETLIIGTFNPHTPDNKADFFYGRHRNFLWRLMPLVFGEVDLKGADLHLKLDFICRRKVDLIDVIEEVKVEPGQETNYMDSYLDKQDIKWRNVIQEMEKLTLLKRVCFTRKSFSDIPNIKKEILKISDYCSGHGIFFKALTTPARIYSEAKQWEWNEFFSADTDALPFSRST